jgi:hypothetical protein
MKTVLFTNWTNEDFDHTYGGESFSFKAGSSVYLQDFLAEFFAKHLANRELHKNKDSKFHSYVNNPKNPIFAEYVGKCLGEVSEAQTELKGEADLAEKNAELDKEELGSDIKPKGKKKAVKPKDSEEEFEGLKE